MTDSKQVTDLTKLVAALEGNQEAMLDRLAVCETTCEGLTHRFHGLRTSTEPELTRIWTTLDALRADLTALDLYSARFTELQDAEQHCAPVRDPDGHAVKQSDHQRPCGCEDSQRLALELVQEKERRDAARTEAVEMLKINGDHHRTIAALRTGLSNLEFRQATTEKTNADLTSEVLELRAFRAEVQRLLESKGK
jgi:hypothetical protein